MARYEELVVTDLIAKGTVTLEAAVTLEGAVTVDGALTVSNAVVNIANLPTSDPTVAGQLWSNAGVVTVSAG